VFDQRDTANESDAVAFTRTSATSAATNDVNDANDANDASDESWLLLVSARSISIDEERFLSSVKNDFLTD
jgi:hypothetical protein